MNWDINLVGETKSVKGDTVLSFLLVFFVVLLSSDSWGLNFW